MVKYLRQLDTIPRRVWLCVWPWPSTDRASTGYSCQSYLWSAGQGKFIFPVPVRVSEIAHTSYVGLYRPTLARSSSTTKLNPMLTYGTPLLLVVFLCDFYHNRHPPSSQSRVHQLKQMCVDGILDRESAGSGPKIRKVVLLTGAVTGNFVGQFMCAPLFPRPLQEQWTRSLPRVLPRIIRSRCANNRTTAFSPTTVSTNWPDVRSTPPFGR